jgi:acyl carrier protein
MIWTRDTILQTLGQNLHEMFEVPMDQIRPEARLYEDLDLDSLDAVDLAVQLQELTGRRIAPAEFKTVRTVGDVVDRIHALLAD